MGHRSTVDDHWKKWDVQSGCGEKLKCYVVICVAEFGA